MILKAAPETPWSATFIGRIAAEHTDMPAGVLNVLTSSDRRRVGELLASDPRVDVVSFTGSTATGRRVMELAAATVKRVFLELGGKSATIVLDDADFSTRAAGRLCGVLPRRPGLRDTDAAAAAAVALRGRRRVPAGQRLRSLPTAIRAARARSWGR